MYATGPAIFCPIKRIPRYTPLFYADFENGTPDDLIAPPASWTVLGPPTYSAGDILLDNFGVATAVRAAWTATKFNQIHFHTTPWTLELFFTFYYVPAGENFLIRLLNTASQNYLINLYGSGVNAQLETPGAPPTFFTGTIITPGSSHHLVLQSNGSIYLDGALVPENAATTQGWGGLSGDFAQLQLGGQSFRGNQSWSCSWIRITTKVLYNAPFFPAGPINPP